MKSTSTQTRLHRQRRTRLKLKDQGPRPRPHVYRSNRYLYAQIIDDAQAKTIVAASEKELKTPGKTKTERAHQVGALLATKSKTKKITQGKFDRGRYRYHGRGKALAESARVGGLIF